MLEIASVVVALLAVAAAVTYYTYTLQAQTRLRKANLLMGLYAKLDTLEFQEAWHRIFWMEFADYDDAIRQLGGRPTGSVVFYFYDEVGILLRHRLIDEALAYDMFGNSLFQMWEKVRPIIEEARQRSDDPTIYENWEYIYDRLRRRSSAGRALEAEGRRGEAASQEPDAHAQSAAGGSSAPPASSRND
jgi:hypothetical protein